MELKYKLNIQYFGEGEPPEPPKTDPETSGTDSGDERKFTQNDLNNKIAEQKREYEQANAKFLEELGVTNQSEIKKKFESYENELNTYKLKDKKTNALAAAGLGLDLVDLISASDDETINAQVNLLASKIVNKPDKKIEPPINPEKGAPKSGDLADSLEKRLEGKRK